MLRKWQQWVCLGSLLWLFSLGVGFAASRPAPDFLSWLLKIDSMQSSFIQSDSSQPGQKKQGHLLFLRHSMQLKWMYAPPSEQVVWVDGRKVRVYDRDLDQVIVGDMADYTDASPMLVLSDPRRLLVLFQLKSVIQQSKDRLKVVLERKAKNHMVRQIVLEFKDQALSMIQLEDSFGQRSGVAFVDAVFNQEIAPERFKIETTDQTVYVQP